MTSPESSLLGKPVSYNADYDPNLLFPIPRAGQREALGIGDELPFVGVDFWNAYELSWLDNRGKPRVALAELRVPAASPNLIESKSLKLYLGSCAMARFADADTLRAQLAGQLEQTLAELRRAAADPAFFPGLIRKYLLDKTRGSLEMLGYWPLPDGGEVESIAQADADAARVATAAANTVVSSPSA
mgnify:CR=1 FL=1